MKKHHPTLPTKREPVRKGVMKRLHAITKNRKQRVAAVPMAGDFDNELPGRKIGMALAVIVGVHVVAAGLVFFHHWRYEGRGGDAASTGSASTPALLSPGKSAAGPQIPTDGRHTVVGNDNYENIAAKHQVSVDDLRHANADKPIRTGLMLDIPAKKIQAIEPPEIAEVRANQPDANRGIVEIPKATVVPEAPRLIKPKASRESADSFRAVERHEKTTEAPRTASRETKESTKTIPKATPVTKPATTPKPKVASASKSYTVREGDNLWRISSRLKVDQAKLMKANGITDVKKLKPGMTLSIPN